MASPILNHNPAFIVRQLLIDKGWGADSTGKYRDRFDAAGKKVGQEYFGSPWPVFANGEPDVPDSCITVYNPPGVVHGRRMVGGRTETHYGVQLRVRAARDSAGYARASLLEDALDEESTMVEVTIDGSAYLIWSIGRTGDTLPLGPESPTSKRRLYTINALMAVVMR